MTPRSLMILLVLAPAAIAQVRTNDAAPRSSDRSAGDASDYSLTVYSTADPALFDPEDLERSRRNGSYNPYVNQLPGYGVVRETRSIDLSSGVNTLRVTDVASGIDPTTVSFKSLTAPDSTSVLEQNYEYDLVDFRALLSKYIGKQISITRNSRTFPATLLSADYTSIIYREGGSEDGPVQAMKQDPDAIQFSDLRGLQTKPTLVWKISAEKAGNHQALISYQTDGLTWRADYNVVVNQKETAADLGAWVTLLNQSGASYPDTKLKLIAGDVQRLKPPQEQYGGRNGGQQLFGNVGQTGFVEKSFFEYHL